MAKKKTAKKPEPTRDALRSKISRRDKTIAALQSHVESIEDELNERGKTLDVYGKSLVAIRNQRDEASDRANTCCDEAERLRSKLETLQAEEAITVGLLEDETKENRRLHSHIKSLDTSMEARGNVLPGLLGMEAKFLTCEARLEEEFKMRTELNSTIYDLRQERDKLSDEITERKKENDAMRADLRQVAKQHIITIDRINEAHIALRFAPPDKPRERESVYQHNSPEGWTAMYSLIEELKIEAAKNNKLPDAEYDTLEVIRTGVLSIFKALGDDPTSPLERNTWTWITDSIDGLKGDIENAEIRLGHYEEEWKVTKECLEGEHERVKGQLAKYEQHHLIHGCKPAELEAEFQENMLSICGLLGLSITPVSSPGMWGTIKERIEELKSDLEKAHGAAEFNEWMRNADGRRTPSFKDIIKSHTLEFTDSELTLKVKLR